MKSMTFPDIDSLLAYATYWAQASVKSTASFTDSSDDGGWISLETSDYIKLSENYYSIITINGIKIPEKRQRERLYSKFLEKLDGICDFGARFHSETKNDWLADHHRKHGYVEVFNGGATPSFYIIIGEPTILSDQEKRLLQDAQSRSECWGTSSRKRGYGLVQRSPNKDKK